jgi:hypothetical protein
MGYIYILTSPFGKSYIGQTTRPIQKRFKHKQKISEAQLGKTHSEETKQKISESLSGEKNYRSKRVYQYDLEGNELGTFPSTGEAARYLKKKSGSIISRCARGKLKSAHGFKWSYTIVKE